MDEHGRALADGIEAALPGWVERSVRGTLLAAGAAVDPGVMAAAAEAGRRARDDVGGRVRTLLEKDFDDQETTPLSLLRLAVRYPTEVLAGAGAPPVRRDHVAEALQPDDVYDLDPVTFADVDASLAEPGLAWGAAKAFDHLRRRSPTP